MAMMATYVLDDRNQDATVYVGNLDEKVTETTLWELFLQGGPVVSVHLPKDRVSYLHQGFGFVEFVCEEDADYCIKIMNMIKLYGKPIRVNKASTHQKNLDVGANVFVGNLDTEVDEKLLYDTFSAFGVILQTPKIMRDYQMGTSKGFAFINYGTFEASDAAIEAMNGQFLCNRPITVTYAYKKDSRGERHGSAAERILAMQNPLSLQDKPHQKFADAPPNPSAAAPPTRMPFPPGAPGANAPYIPAQQFSSDATQNPQMFPPPPMGQMPPPPMGNMPPPPMGNMPPPPMGNMHPPPMGQMPPPPMGHMPPPPIGQMHPPPMGHMPYPQMGHMPPPPMGHMHPPPMGQMPPHSMGQNPPPHMGQIPPPHMGQRLPPYSMGGGPGMQPFPYPQQQDYRMNMYPPQPPAPPSQ